MSDLVLPEERLNELLAKFKQALERPYPTRSTYDGCLGLERLRTLALAEQVTDVDTEQHLRSCARCRRQLEQLEAAMPHLPVRVLLGAERGLLTPSETRAANRHLSPEACRWCRERARSFQAVQHRVAEWSEVLPLPRPDALAAGTRGLSAIASSPDTTLEAELSEERPGLVLEVRTRDASLSQGPVGYLLYGRQRRSFVEGFTLLRPDVDGWFTGHATFPKGDLYARLAGCCERIVISPLPPAAVGATERGPLLAAAAEAHDEPTRSIWRQWLSETEAGLRQAPAQRIPPTPRAQLSTLLAELRAYVEPGDQRSP